VRPLTPSAWEWGRRRGGAYREQVNGTQHPPSCWSCGRRRYSQSCRTLRWTYALVLVVVASRSTRMFPRACSVSRPGRMGGKEASPPASCATAAARSASDAAAALVVGVDGRTGAGSDAGVGAGVDAGAGMGVGAWAGTYTHMADMKIGGLAGAGTGAVACKTRCRRTATSWAPRGASARPRGHTIIWPLSTSIQPDAGACIVPGTRGTTATKCPCAAVPRW
jgi:hypothetical protein